MFFGICVLKLPCCYRLSNLDFSVLGSDLILVLGDLRKVVSWC